MEVVHECRSVAQEIVSSSWEAALLAVAIPLQPHFVCSD